MNNWLNALQPIERLGEVKQSLGLKLVAKGPPQAFVGELCDILDSNNIPIAHAEVIGFENSNVYLMPFSNAPISMGMQVRATGECATIPVSKTLQGRIVDAFANPIDGGQPIHASEYLPLQRRQINPFHRQPITERVYTGIHTIDALLPIGKGQRVGLFAGSGVGKSMLLGMMAKRMTSDVNVIALIGERGREVNDFIHNHLDKEVLQKSVIIVACSDDFALIRKQAVYTATTIAEYFCQQGNDVMLFMDSITRFAMAQREIGLSLGEPPTSRGYTPTVFSSLPCIVERAGNFQNAGSITALYTVLVEGDDFNEPIADTMRSLLDGHIILTRELANRGQYPAIDVLQSISRLAGTLSTPEHMSIIKQITSLLSVYQQNKDLIELGAYQPGHYPQLDNAVKHIDTIRALLNQSPAQSLSPEIVLERLKACLP